MIREINDKILSLLFPAICPFCREIVKKSSECCVNCRKELPYIGTKYCYKCGKQLHKDQYELCEDCMQNFHYYEKGRAVFVHEGPVKDAIYALKYENMRVFADFFVEEMDATFGEWIRHEDFSAIMPIPLSEEKRRQRGYNQAELLSAALSKKTGIAHCLNCITRINNTAPQKLLAHDERKNNLKNAFKTSLNGVQLDKVLLVDDIYTTGNTIDAVAKELRMSGVNEVYFVAISIGKGL